MGQTRSADMYGKLVCKAVRLLAEGYSTESTAREVGVKRRTLLAWMRGDDFQTLENSLRDFGYLAKVREMLETLTPDAMEAMRRTLQGGNATAAAHVARDVLKWANEYAVHEREMLGQTRETVIRVEYGTPDGKPYSSAAWADRHPPKGRDSE